MELRHAAVKHLLRLARDVHLLHGQPRPVCLEQPRARLRGAGLGPAVVVGEERGLRRRPDAEVALQPDMVLSHTTEP